VTVFTHRFEVDAAPGASRLAVKCSIDVQGLVSHAGSVALARTAAPATSDATIVRQAREAGAVIVGHTVMPELGLNTTGINPVMGTPTNPRDPDRVPGGSSAGSAVAVASGQADVAYGTDAGGSCRIPPACCGVVGLKPTQDRWSMDGVIGLTYTMDVAGPLARDVAGVLLGTTWMDPSFQVGDRPARRIGRLRVGDVAPHIDASVDAALARHGDVAGVTIIDVDVDDIACWRDAYNAGGILLVDEGWRQHGRLLELHPDGFTPAAADKLRLGGTVDDAKRAWVAATRDRIRSDLDRVLADVDALALPTIPIVPPRLDEAGPDHDLVLSRLTIAFNLSGHPSLAMPVPTDGHAVPASLQLVTGHHDEEHLLATALAIESSLLA